MPTPAKPTPVPAPRTYLVTGAASGIGKATVAHLRAHGHTVIGADLQGTDITADLATPDGRKQLVDHARELTGGRLDAVIASAGLAQFVPRTVHVNYFGVVATLEGLRPLLAAGTNPRAVLLSSVASIHPADQTIVDAALAGDEEAAVTAAQAAVDRGEGYAIYGASKQAIARWLRRTAISDDWAATGIPLNAVAPGTTVTPMTEPMLADAEVRKAVDAGIPMPLRGHARPEQVAPLLAWLTSPENTHVTGQVIFLDGGADAVLRGDNVW
ncbi:SDR family oxidoreductase [Streptomyces tubercidicus]|uniref:Short-chain dehydrogenase n=1 Tax=Streptomyces tubercidicus TaxID=47759 RepID=A0A640UJZ2_9ACTN|nr:SDR family oxidoreductase [Streptomyces tubercidicus]WAU10929.1 SDR family oxidoreductase [Streptomyces tubercidicus]GFE36117.1 short-chain dehydrogenase [Streptomyces tubercidicus]